MASQSHRKFSQSAESTGAGRSPIPARDLLHTILHLNPIPTALASPQGTLLEANAAYARLLGNSSSEFGPAPAAEIRLPFRGAMWAGLTERLQRERAIENLEMEILDASGRARRVLVSMARVSRKGTDWVIVLFLNEMVNFDAQQPPRWLASRLAAAEQAERNRISRILHDDLQQRIFAVKMQLTFLQEALERNDLEALKLDVRQLDQWLEEAIATTRHLSGDLRSPNHPGEDFEEAIFWLAAEIRDQQGLAVTVDTTGLIRDLPNHVHTLLLQSIRELLLNVVDHSGSKNASVEFLDSDAEMIIRVNDSGEGFDAAATLQKVDAMSGLIRMRERLALLGLALAVQSEPGVGTRVTISVPHSYKRE